MSYIQAFNKVFLLNSEMSDFVPITLKTDVIAGSTITEMSAYMAGSPAIYRLFNKLNIFPSDSLVAYNNEPTWIPSNLPDTNRTWNVVSCDSNGENGIPIGTISTGRMDSQIS